MIEVEPVRIGAGAGFSGDRLEPAVILAERGRIQFLVLECLAERTIALAQLRRRQDPDGGTDPLLDRRMALLLPVIHRNGVRIVTNMGAANPLAGARRVVEIAGSLGLRLRVAAVTGDDVLATLDREVPALESGRPLREYGALLSANAYLGADALLPALESGADVVVTGRVADPSLFVAPIAHQFGWRMDDVERVARATVVGHLLECAGQVSGGYFADPGKKEVPGLATLGFPFADVDEEGNGSIGKVDGTGGRIDIGTVTEQLLYEVTDPSGYVTPDVVVDFTTVRLRENAPDRVAVSGATGRPRPSLLKASIGYQAGFVGEGELSYAGTNAVARARLAADIVRERLRGEVGDIRVDLIGSTSLHGRSFLADEKVHEVRLRVAARCAAKEQASRVGEEVEALYTNGPAGGGGARKSVTEQVGIVSCLIPRDRAVARVTLFESRP
ncbi:MAG: acyclic terpene utilization AtuA family protein [Myxococcales bacterium]